MDFYRSQPILQILKEHPLDRGVDDLSAVLRDQPLFMKFDVASWASQASLRSAQRGLGGGLRIELQALRFHSPELGAQKICDGLHRSSQRHGGNIALDDQLSLGGFLDVLQGHARGQLSELQAALDNIDEGQVGHDAVHAPDAGQRQTALL